MRMKIDNHYAPIISILDMHRLVIDITALSCKNNYVTILGPNKEITINDYAAASYTIGNEIVTSLTADIARYIVP